MSRSCMGVRLIYPCDIAVLAMVDPTVGATVGVIGVNEVTFELEFNVETGFIEYKL